MRIVQSYPGSMEHAHQIALALIEADALEAYVTAFAYRKGDGLDVISKVLPSQLGEKIRRQLRRRAPPDKLAPFVHTAATGWEIARTLADLSPAGPVWTDRVWDAGAHEFDAAVARNHVSRARAVGAFEYTALETFLTAERLGRAKILHIPSLHNQAIRDRQLAERERWPEFASPHDAYFDRKFATRQARRDAEVAAADVIIVNSTLTRASHIAGGADPEKIHVVPLAAPATASAVPDRNRAEPLRIIWSGGFSLGKGAHQLLQAWSRLRAGHAARLTVYGKMLLPAALRAEIGDGIEFKGSRPRDEVLDAYSRADVLVFPSLADGFGMSVAEALSRGTPVIVSDQAGAADLIEPGVNGLIIPAGDTEALVQSLTWCLDNREALQAMAAGALASAEARQWPHYRRDLRAALQAGLIRAGYPADLASAADLLQS